eukprot:2355147-Lingulodinium_polyedra.AAC.1
MWASGLSRRQTQQYTNLNWVPRSTRLHANWIQLHSKLRSQAELCISRRTPRSANESAVMPKRRKASSE